MTTVAATCACGSSFQREVRRGRPQVWCNECMAIPFAKRERLVEASVEAVEPRALAQWDVLTHVRDQVEADVAEVYSTWGADFAALVASGVTADEAQMTLGDRLRDVYSKYRGKGKTAVTAEEE